MRHILPLIFLLTISAAMVGCAQQQQQPSDRLFSDAPLGTVTEGAAVKSLAFPQSMALASNYVIPREDLNPYAAVGYDSEQVTTSYRVIQDYQGFAGSYGGGYFGYGGGYQRRTYEVVQQQRVR